MSHESAGLPYTPAELVPPGETLLDWLRLNEMTQAQLAKRTSLTAKHINALVKGSASISADVALSLEHVTSVPARYWIQLDANYQAEVSRSDELDRLSAHVEIVDLFPYKRLQSLGLVPETRSKTEKLIGLLRFFGVATPQALKDLWLQPAMLRSSKSFEPKEGALAAWLRMAELEAASADSEPFDLQACRDSIPDMRALSLMPGTSWLEPLQRLCASFGVVLVVIKELPGCRINGATRWLSPERAMIAMSFRYRRVDIFWFTFFHELCHVTRHSKKTTFIDRNVGSGVEELEQEADAFAARTLIPPQVAHRLSGLRTKADVLQFAEEIGVAPGTVVGRMQHDDFIGPNKWTDLIDRYSFPDD